MSANLLYYGDNLDVMRRDLPDESVDLVYLDPPFNSSQEYNVLFVDEDGTRAAAQEKAFVDTWGWNAVSEQAYACLVETGPEKVSQVLQAFRTFLGENNIMAYIAMMAPRLLELRRVLKSSGSLYLHCDPNASHYLKILLDAIFGPGNFKSEIIWARTTNTGSSKAIAKRFSTDHDVILFYAKDRKRCEFLPQFRDYNKDYIRRYYTHDDHDGHGVYQIQALKTASAERIAQLRAEGRIVDGNGRYLRFKDYLKGKKGVPVNDLWMDIEPVNPVARERLGYPTQKPEALLERIIRASCPEGGTVLDPFCGCGTTVAAAQKLGRRWIGIDVTISAIKLIRDRLSVLASEVKYTVNGLPTTIAEARALAGQDRYQFQWWAMDFLGVRGDPRTRGADRGIDGRLYFWDDNSKGKAKQIIFSVKSGNVDVSQVRDLIGVVNRERAQIGVLITLRDPTRAMRTEATTAGFYNSPWGGQYPSIQILTIDDLFAGRAVAYPDKTGGARHQTHRTRHVPAPIAEALELPLVTDPQAILAERAKAAAERKAVAASVPSTQQRTPGQRKAAKPKSPSIPRGKR